MVKIKEIKKVPVGVKIISVWYYIGAVIIVLLSLLYLFGSRFAGSLVNRFQLFAIFGVSFFIVIGIILMGFGVLSFFIARGLWKAKNWARIAAIILACVGIFITLTYIVMGDIEIIPILFNGIVGGYLLFNKNVKIIFRK